MERRQRPTGLLVVYVHLALDATSNPILDPDRAPQERVVERFRERDDQGMRRATRGDLETPGRRVQRYRVGGSHREPLLERRLQRIALSVGPCGIDGECIGFTLLQRPTQTVVQFKSLLDTARVEEHRVAQVVWIPELAA